MAAFNLKLSCILIIYATKLLVKGELWKFLRSVLGNCGKRKNSPRSKWRTICNAVYERINITNQRHIIRKFLI